MMRQRCRFGITGLEFLHFPATLWRPTPKEHGVVQASWSGELLMSQLGLSRRRALKAGAAIAGAFAAPAIVSNHVLAQVGTRPINLQLGFLAGGNQLGEIVAKHMGY